MEDVDDKTCLQLWQSLRFSVDKNETGEYSGDAFQMANIYRSLLHQINFAGLTKRISSKCEIKLKEKYLTEYGKLIDDPQGINNYAEMSLDLAAHKRNESAQWNSALETASDEELLKLIPESCRKTEERDNDKKEFWNMFLKEKHLLRQPKEINELLKVTDVKNEIFIGNQLTKQMNDCAKPEDYKCSLFSATSNKKHEQGATTSNSGGYPSYNVNIQGTHSQTNRYNFSLQQAKTDPENNIDPVLHTTFYDSSNAKGVHCKGEMQNNRSQYSSIEKGMHWKATANSRMFDFQNSFPQNEPVVISGERKRKQPLDYQDEKVTKNAVLSFKTAKEQMIIEQHKKHGSQTRNSMVYGNSRKCLGTRRGLNSKFVPPVINKDSNDDYGQNVYGAENKTSETTDNFFQDEKLKNIDSKMVELMLNEIMDHGPPVSWDDIAGLEFAKTTIKEIVVWPMLRPDIFTGLRGPPKGILLFGPPGTGKTLIGKCIASQSKSTFFCISASSLTSKWVGEGEKLVRALFAVARCYQPAVIFIDEIDSLLTQRSDTEHESSRRIKTEFLVQLDGATTSNDERLLIVGATNRPQELDEAARRRLVKRLYIPLPESHARRQIVKTLLYSHSHDLTESDLDAVCEKTEGYSGADMANLCKEAALGPIRSLNFEDIEHITSDQVRPIVLRDFLDALKQVRASVSDRDLELYSEWNSKYGSGYST